MSVAHLILIALAIFVVLIVGGALIGAIVNLLQCLVFAAIVAVGATFLVRLVLMRIPPPASQQIIDQPPSPPDPIDTGDQAQKQVQERIERLKRDGLIDE